MVRVFGVLSAIALTFPIPAACQTVTAGKWSIEGSKGDCTGAMSQGETLVIFVSPASGGENEGGLVILNEGWAVEDGKARITIDGNGPLAGERNATAIGKLHGYWVGAPRKEFLQSFPDRWRLTAHMGTTLLADVELTDFRLMAAAVMACVERTRG